MQGVQFTHSGSRYSLGFDPSAYVIWDRAIGPVQRFPRTDQGWAQAWTAYAQLEPANIDLRGGGATARWTSTTAEGVPAGFVGYAGFWRRFAAYLIDSFLVGVALVPLSNLLGSSQDAVVIASLGRAVVAWIYSALLESSPKQATVGKMALNIAVTDLEGRRISFGKATGRHFARYLSVLTLGIGLIMIAFTKRKQALHDMLAGTLVVLRP